MRFIAVALACLALAGCVAPPQSTAPQEPTVTTTRDEFRKITQYRSSDVMGRSSDSLFIRAWRGDAQPVTYQIYVADYYSGDWRFYTSAYDLDGHRYDTTQIGRDVGYCSRYGGCSKTETMGLNVTRAYLEQFRNRDLTFKLIGKAGEQIFTLPAAFTRKFLEVVQDDSPRATTITAPQAAPARLPATPTPQPSSQSQGQGQDAPNASRAAASAGCTQKSAPSLVGKGPGFESYTVACTNGDTLMLRCEFGNCRVLR